MMLNPEKTPKVLSKSQSAANIKMSPFLTIAQTPTQVMRKSGFKLKMEKSFIQKNKEKILEISTSRNNSKESLDRTPRSVQIQTPSIYKRKNIKKLVLNKKQEKPPSKVSSVKKSSRRTNSDSLPLLSSRVIKLSSRFKIPENHLSPVARNILSDRYSSIKRKIKSTTNKKFISQRRKENFQKFKFQLFKGLLYQGDRATQKEVNSFFMKDNREIMGMYKSRKKPKYLRTIEPRKKKKFQWSNSLKKIKESKTSEDIFEANLIDIPSWLKENSDFKDLLKQRVKQRKLKLLKIIEKFPHLRRGEEKEKIIQWLYKINDLKGFDYFMYIVTSEHLLATSYIDNTFLFEKNEIPTRAFILYQGTVKNLDTGEEYKPGSMIFKKYLEDDDVFVDHNYMTIGRSILFSLSKKAYQDMLSEMFAPKKAMLKEDILKNGLFKSMNPTTVETIMKSVTYKVRAENELLIELNSMQENIYFIAEGEIKIVIPIKLYEEISLPRKDGKKRFERKLFSQTYTREILIGKFNFVNLEPIFLQEETNFEAVSTKKTVLMCMPYKVFISNMTNDDIRFTKNICFRRERDRMLNTKKFLKEKKAQNKKMSKVLSSAFHSQIDNGNVNDKSKLKKLEDIYQQMQKREISSVVRTEGLA